MVRLGVHAEVVHIFRFLELSVADLWSGQRGEGEVGVGWKGFVLRLPWLQETDAAWFFGFED